MSKNKLAEHWQTRLEGIALIGKLHIKYDVVGQFPVNGIARRLLHEHLVGEVSIKKGVEDIKLVKRPTHIMKEKCIWN